MDTLAHDKNYLSYAMEMFAKNITMFVLQTRECHSLPKSTCRAQGINLSRICNCTKHGNRPINKTTIAHFTLHILILQLHKL